MKQIILARTIFLVILQVILTNGVEARRQGAVASNGIECAKIATDVLEEGGSAADAAIAATFCESVANPHAIGMGGGFLATIYIRHNRSGEFLNARETAPSGVNAELYEKTSALSKKGIMSVAVPGALKGLWELHQRHGHLNWTRLIQPSIDLCNNGIEVSQFLADISIKYESMIRENPSLSEIFINPVNNETYKVGEKIYRPKLAETYQKIAFNGGNTLYKSTGVLLKRFLKDIRAFGGVITEEDLTSYRTEWEIIDSSVVFRKLHLFAAGLPGSGPLVKFFLDVLSKVCRTDCDTDSPTLWQKVIETFKFGFAQRPKLGDPNFNAGMQQIVNQLQSPQFITKAVSKIKLDETSNDPNYYGPFLAQQLDHGTAHISVLAPNGDAVSLTGSINYFFGSGLRSINTGIILNNQMADFTVTNDPQSANKISPGKRPLSSMTPLVMTDSAGNVKYVAGAAGGAKITQALVNLFVRRLYLNQDLTESITSPMIYHFLKPMKVQYEELFKPSTIDALRSYGHDVKKLDSGAGITVIYNSTFSNQIYANFDPRRGGSVSYVENL